MGVGPPVFSAANLAYIGLNTHCMSYRRLVDCCLFGCWTQRSDFVCVSVCCANCTYCTQFWLAIGQSRACRGVRLVASLKPNCGSERAAAEHTPSFVQVINITRGPTVT